MQDLRTFIAEAHEHGYASRQPNIEDGGVGTVITHYRDAWGYQDRYYGSDAFVGSEIVTFDEQPIWGMSYYGSLCVSQTDGSTVYAFLRDALRRATPDRPYRGPSIYECAERTYRSTVSGDITEFRGTEEIEDDEVTIYRGTFCGGRIG